MRLAILGSGMIVKDFLSVAGDVEGLELVAICGRPTARPGMEALQERYGIGRVYTDLDQCLADDEVDTVYVGLPNSLHAQYARRALLAGKHVICEKPFTVRLDDLLELRALAEQRGLILVEAITTQYLSNYQSIREHLPELGDLKLVQCEYSQYSSRYPAFRAGEVLPAFDPAMGGGALMDLGIYTLHFVVGLLGRPRSITYTANIERGVDTSGVMVLDYDGVTALCICAKDSSGPVRTKIQGNAGTIVMAATPNECGPYSLYRQPGDDRFGIAAGEVVDATVHQHRMVEEFRAFQAMIDTCDLAWRDERLDHSQLVLELATQALASAGIRLGT